MLFQRIRLEAKLIICSSRWQDSKPFFQKKKKDSKPSHQKGERKSGPAY